LENAALIEPIFAQAGAALISRHSATEINSADWRPPLLEDFQEIPLNQSSA
jgi:hypothetical protein